MLSFFIISSLLFSFILYPIFISDEIIITYGIHPFDICQKNPELWSYLKITYIISFICSNLIFSNFIFTNFISKFFNSKNNSKNLNSDCPIPKDSSLSLLIGYDQSTNSNVFIPESGLYQNFLITGTIGSGKTSSIMYPLTEQLIRYNSLNKNDKIGMLILDVKGNYYEQVRKYSEKYNLLDDLIVIELGSNITYNPLDKPHIKPQVLSNRLKTILTLFSENNSESYWLDEAEKIITECIKLCRLYNNGYVTFEEINKLITDHSYYEEKITLLKNLFLSSKFTQMEIYDLNSSLNFFQKEFDKLDSRTLAILKSEITMITNLFLSDYEIKNTFCPKKENLTFNGFSEAIEKGKIVVLNMNIAEYKNLSKVIAAYLKLDFQSEVLNNLAKKQIKKTAFICDEYSEYATKTDTSFFAVSREAKCINIVSTQSYSSLKCTLKDDSSLKVLTQNLINKIWFRTDDILTIEEAQKQLGKEEKSKVSHSLSESAKETNYNYFLNSLYSKNSNISESYNTYTQSEFIYDTNYFTQCLETFTALTFLSNGKNILKPKKLEMFPYFLRKE